MTDPARPARAPKCPICSKPTDSHYRPFCSKRCADIDLGRWLGGGYAISGADSDEQPEDGAVANDENELD